MSTFHLVALGTSVGFIGGVYVGARYVSGAVSKVLAELASIKASVEGVVISIENKLPDRGTAVAPGGVNVAPPPAPAPGINITPSGVVPATPAKA